MRLALSAWCSIRHFTQDTIIIFPRPSETRFSFEGKEEFERRFHSNVYDSYPGPGHYSGNLENNRLQRSTSPGMGIIKATTRGASCNQKDQHEKRKRSTIHGSNLES